MLYFVVALEIVIIAIGAKILMTQQEALDALTAANASLDGISADIAALVAAAGNAGNLTPELTDAITTLKDKAAAIDAQNP